MKAKNRSVSYTGHDELPPEDARLIDDGLGSSNEDAAPLHEVRPLACFARVAGGRAVGGAVGRSWGSCCELQQLWVEPAQRRHGIGARLVREFEQLGVRRGCTTFYLETFSFQAPRWYRSLGYEVKHELSVYPHGIVKYTMVRVIPVQTGEASGVDRTANDVRMEGLG